MNDLAVQISYNRRRKAIRTAKLLRSVKCCLLAVICSLMFACGSPSSTNGVRPSAPITVSIFAPSPSVQELASITLTAAVAGTQDTRIEWRVNGISGGNSSVGTITAAGLYTAPLLSSFTKSVTITATSAADPSAIASTSLAITADTASPTVTGFFPAAGSQGIALDSVVQITFDKPIAPSSITSANFVLTQGGATIPSVVVGGADPTTVTITPTQLLVPNSTYAVNVSANVVDAIGNHLAQAESSNFTTANALTVNGIVKAAPGINVSTLTVISNGQESAVAADGTFQAQLAPRPNVAVVAMLPDRPFAYIALVQPQPASAATALAHQHKFQITASQLATATVASQVAI